MSSMFSGSILCLMLIYRLEETPVSFSSLENIPGSCKQVVEIEVKN